MAKKKGLIYQHKTALTPSEKDVLHLLTEEFLIVKQIQQRRHCSLQAVYKLIKKLKQKGAYEYPKKLQPSCYFCDNQNSIEKHHVIQRKYNGLLHEKENILYLCHECHWEIHRAFRCLYLSKGNYFLINFLTSKVIKFPSEKSRFTSLNQPIKSMSQGIKSKKLIVEYD